MNDSLAVKKSIKSYVLLGSMTGQSSSHLGIGLTEESILEVFALYFSIE